MHDKKLQVLSPTLALDYLITTPIWARMSFSLLFPCFFRKIFFNICPRCAISRSLTIRSENGIHESSTVMYIHLVSSLIFLFLPHSLFDNNSLYIRSIVTLNFFLFFLFYLFWTRQLLLSGSKGLCGNLSRSLYVGGWVSTWRVCYGVGLYGPWNSMSSMSFSCTCS